MNRKYIALALYILGGTAWIIFCVVAVPKFQKQQRELAWERQQEFDAPLGELSAIKEPIEVADEIGDTEETSNVSTEDAIYAKYTDPDLILLAQLIEAEGGVESYQCKLCIGSIVLNRMVSDDFPDSLRGVIFEERADGLRQFSVTYPGADGTRPIDCEPSAESLDAAAELITYGTQLPKEVVVFYAAGCTDDWVTSRAIYKQIDNTIFAYVYSK